MLEGIVAAGLTLTLVRAKVESGVLEGTENPVTGIRSFVGVPFAAPPIGDLRWKAPQPIARWQGARAAKEFAHRPMQLPLFGDMVWRSPGISEDCLYLNVWAPAPDGSARRRKHPVLVYFYGGGFQAGDSSEPRYDGESMARQGIVAVTVNYRLGVFGFFAHPELTKESPHKASGNYGLMDQSAALHWVRKNISAFGGDPRRITIAGESAGSFSVSAQMASPLSRDLLAGAIGESGAFFGRTLAASDREAAEANGAAFGAELKAPTLAELRALSAERILEATKSNSFRFGPIVDGYFFPKSAAEIYAAGEQAKIPLLAGWNSEESGPGGVLGSLPPTPENFAQAVRRLYGDRADEVLRVYPAANDAEAKQAATDLASDRFIGYGTWKWLQLHARTSGRPVFRYFYDQPRPGQGAVHSAEIEYALGNLDRNTVFPWTETDRKVSATMFRAFANFVKTGDPNGSGVPAWPSLERDGENSYMRFAAESRSEPDRTSARYRLLDAILRGSR